MDKNYIYQVSIREWIENDWGKGIFVPVYGGKKFETNKQKSAKK